MVEAEILGAFDCHAVCAICTLEDNEIEQILTLSLGMEPFKVPHDIFSRCLEEK